MQSARFASTCLYAVYCVLRLKLLLWGIYVVIFVEITYLTRFYCAVIGHLLLKLGLSTINNFLNPPFFLLDFWVPVAFGIALTRVFFC